MMAMIEWPVGPKEEPSKEERIMSTNKKKQPISREGVRVRDVSQKKLRQQL